MTGEKPPPLFCPVFNLHRYPGSCSDAF